MEDKPELILRDHLAIDRTRLANERTLLAYSRTVILLLATGITLIKLFPAEQIIVWIGYCMFPLSGIVSIIGLYSYFRTRINIKRSYRK